MFGRPVVIQGGRCSPSFSKEQQADMFRRRQEQIKFNEEAIRQQQEWINKAFGLASEVASELSSSPSQSNEVIRQQQEWVNRAYEMAMDVASGRSSSPHSEINEDDEKFQVAIDVPGVERSAIDVSVDEKDGERILTIKGERVTGKGENERTNKFSRSFALDDSIATESLTAQLSNGVLLVSAPKIRKEVEENSKKIPVMQVTDEPTSTGKADESDDTQHADKDENHDGDEGRDAVSTGKADEPDDTQHDDKDENHNGDEGRDAV